jgi:predicted dehydrogenase
MKKIKAVLVGAGARGSKAYGPYALEHPDEIQFIAVAEPIKARRESFCQEHHIPEEKAFNSYEELLKSGIEADVALICTQDKLHFEPTIMALRNGYNVLLEKPIVSPIECRGIEEEVKKTGKNLTICHVLRYTPFFGKIKELIDGGAIGNVIGITHNENVGYYHAAHSYVRGNWRKTAESSPMILAKSCHDIDILLWLVGDKCKKVSSFGSLIHFKEENAPKDSTDRCISCKCTDNCPYNALDIYMDESNNKWPVNVITDDLSKEGRLKALQEGPYGRCVYRCDNDVVDHQAVIMEFENGVTVTFHMNAFTYNMNRTIRVSGTKGEIIGDMEEEKIELHDFKTDTCCIVKMDKITNNDYGHGGGDYGLINSLVKFLRDSDNNQMKSEIGSAVESHMVTFAAEESRLSNKVINLNEYVY